MSAYSGDPFAVLIGLKLSIVRRAADMLGLHFGDVRPHPISRRGTVAAYALHVQCPWRLTGPSGIVTGRAELWQYAGPGRPPDDWTYENGFSLQDRALGRLIGAPDPDGSWFNKRNRFIVRETDLGRNGDLDLRLGGGYEFSAFPDESDAEAWRFFAPGSRRHLVFCGKRGTIRQSPMKPRRR